MERLVVLLLVSAALAGCTTPADPAPPSLPPREETPSPGEDSWAEVRGVPEIRTLEPPAPAANVSGPAPVAQGNASLPEDPVAQGNASSAPDAPRAPSNASSAATAPTNTTDPMANGSRPRAETDPGPSPPAEPLPVLRPGDRWIYRGANLSGGHYDEVLEVVGPGELAGVLTYLLNVTSRGQNQTLHVTRAGLNPVNGTGFVTALLRFPLAVGANWSFHWEQADRFTPEGSRDPVTLRQTLHGEVRVVGAGNMTTIGGRWPALHLEADLTSSLGTFTKELRLDFWYAPGAKAIVRTDTYYDDGRHAWSELVQVRLAQVSS